MQKTIPSLTVINMIYTAKYKRSFIARFSFSSLSDFKQFLELLCSRYFALVFLLSHTCHSHIGSLLSIRLEGYERKFRVWKQQFHDMKENSHIHEQQIVPQVKIEFAGYANKYMKPLRTFFTLCALAAIDDCKRRMIFPK